MTQRAEPSQSPGHEQYPLEYEPTYPGFGNVMSDECRVNGINTPCEIAQVLIGAGATATESMFFNNEGWHRRQTPLTAIGLGMYGHYEGTGGGVDREWDGVWGSADGAVVNVSQETRRFVVDGVVPRPQNSPISSDEVEAYRVRIETALRDARCSDFVYALLNRVKANTNKSYDNVLDVFKKVKFYYAYPGTHGGTAGFENGERVAYIDNTIKTEKFTSADRNAALIATTARSFMGEILHHVASAQYQVYFDADFATAYNEMRVNGEVFKLMNGKMIPDVDILRSFPGKTKKEIDDASNYWHSSVDRHCKY